MNLECETNTYRKREVSASAPLGSVIVNCCAASFMCFHREFKSARITQTPAWPSLPRSA